MRRTVVVVLAIMAVLTIVMIFYQENIYMGAFRPAIIRRILQSNDLEDPQENYQIRHIPQAVVIDQIENLPSIYINDQSKNRPAGINKTCAKFPDLFDITFSNDHWQTQIGPIGTLQLFSAYLDDRPKNSSAIVRVVGMYDVLVKPQHRFYCLFWYRDQSKPVLVKSDELFRMWRMGWGGETGHLYQPYLIPCPLPRDNAQIPMSVSLVEKPCMNPTNNLRVNYKKLDVEKNFVVCVKGLNFPYQDLTARLAEWIELLNILGVEKINFYEFHVHPNVRKLLEYYSEVGIVELTPLTLVEATSNNPFIQSKFLIKNVLKRRLQEVIPYNDCLYKHINQFKYVVLLDTDEIIVPVRDTWVELMLAVRNQSKSLFASYLARNVYFLDSHQHEHDWFQEFPKYMHMLQHVHRAKEYTRPGYFVKGFHDTKRVLAVHNHFPFACYDGCSHKEINISLAHLQHYRSDCVRGVSDCDVMKTDSVMDTRVWNYKDELIRRVTKVLKDLGMLERIQ